MKILFITSILVVFLFSCKKEVQPALQDLDCSCAKEVSADFMMEETYAYGYEWETRIDTDTIYYNKNVVFTALEENAEYTWLIGSEIISEKTVARYFNQSLAGQTIPIKLIVKKKPNLICFPEDDGIDTLEKNLYISSEDWTNVYDYPNYRFEGTFRMKEKNATDSIDITVYLMPNDEMGVDGLDFPQRFIFVNALGTNEIKNAGVLSINYREFYYDSGQGPDEFFRWNLNGIWELKFRGLHYLGEKK